MKQKNKVERVVQRTICKSIPTMLKFQNGTLETIAKRNTTFYQAQQNKAKNKNVMLLTGNEVYYGDYQNPVSTDSIESFICVRNKVSKRIRIIPINQVTLNHYIFKITKLKQNISEQEYSRQKLLKEFGGRKAAKFIANQENIKVNIDAVKDELANTIQETELNDSTTNINSQGYLDKIRPPFNKDALSICEIYNINDIICLDLMERLIEEAKTVYATPIDNIPISSEYLLDKIREIQMTSVCPENLQRIKIIIYMDCLMNLIKSRVRNLKNLEMSKITEKVENDVRKRFSDPNLKGFSRTSSSTEKALCFFIVLALLINKNYEIDINILTQELKSQRRKILQYAQIVNAKRKGQTNMITLCLPKSIPPVLKSSKRSMRTK